MRSIQDGQGPAPYVTETDREIRALGPGGKGNSESLADAKEHGVTAELMAQTAERARNNPDLYDGDEAIRQPESSGSQTTNQARKAMSEDSTQAVREKAYELWVLEGRPDGRDLAHWDMASKLVAQDDAGHTESGSVENATVLDNPREVPDGVDDIPSAPQPGVVKKSG